MKKLHACRPIATSIMLIFLYSMVSCKKDKKIPEQELSPPAKQILISYVKGLSTEQLVKIKDEGVIRGVVISDASSKNVDNNKTLFLQEGASGNGIMVKLQTDHNFALNDSLEINVFGQTIAKLNGAVVLQDLANDLVKKVGGGKIMPRETSVRELEAHKKDWEGSLIRISACQLVSDNGKYSGNLKITDGKARLASHIIEGAILNDQELPKDVRRIVGIVRLNGDEVRLAPINTKEILPLRYVTDEFMTWKNTTLDFNQAMAPSALHTTFANWQGDMKDGTIKQLAHPADVIFTKPGKIYPYLPKDSLASVLTLLPAGESSLKGLKVIEVTFAATRSIGDVRFSEQSVSNDGIPINVLPFNTGVDEVQVGIEIPMESTGELIPGELVPPKGFSQYYRIALVMPPIKEAGKFYTAKFIIPSTIDDLKAMGIKSINSQKWLENPVLRVINLSSRKTAGITTKNRDRYIPILIDKVEMGY